MRKYDNFGSLPRLNSETAAHRARQGYFWSASVIRSLLFTKSGIQILDLPETSNF